MPKITTFPSDDKIPVFAEVADRVEFIADLMEGLCWKRGKSAKVLAKAWNLSKSAIENYSSEASRRIEADASHVRRLVSQLGEEMLITAYRAGKAKDFSMLAQRLSEISGANAPIKQEINVTDDASPAKARELLGTAFRGDVGKRPDHEPDDDSRIPPETDGFHEMMTDAVTDD